MAELVVGGSTLGNSLQELLNCEEIVPGSTPSYEMCKIIYAFHPLGAKMADAPITMAQSQQREIAVPKGPEDKLREAFFREWEEIGADKTILNTMRLSRVYGIASVAMLAEGVATDVPISPKDLHKHELSFNVFDPLNTAGSLVLSQDPKALDFQKPVTIEVSGQRYHRSRAVVMMNESPLYIEYQPAAFGFVGRSIYQRALFPLKSFVQTMVTDDMVTKKAGLLIAKQRQGGSLIDNIMVAVAALKRNMLKIAGTNNVLTIDVTEAIETLNMQNLDGAYGMARTNLLKNIATAADMPAKLLENETMVAGFGEGVEDAKNIARYVDGIRMKMQPLYAWMDKIVMRRAWNPEFYLTIQKLYPEEYGKTDYTEAFWQWSNSFVAKWPNLLTEPESQAIQVDNVKLQAAVAAYQVMTPNMDPQNQAVMAQWLADTFNELKLMFGTPLNLDVHTLLNHLTQQMQMAQQQQQMAMQPQGGEQQEGGREPPPPRPFRGDAAVLDGLNKSVAKLIEISKAREARRYGSAKDQRAMRRH